MKKGVKLEGKKSVAERIDMMNSAIASVRMEGIPVDKETERELMQVALGEVTDEDYRQKVLDEVEKLKKEKPELFGGEIA